jgi:hypothetical protein
MPDLFALIPPNNNVTFLSLENPSYTFSIPATIGQLKDLKAFTIINWHNKSFLSKDTNFYDCLQHRPVVNTAINECVNLKEIALIGYFKLPPIDALTKLERITWTGARIIPQTPEYRSWENYYKVDFDLIYPLEQLPAQWENFTRLKTFKIGNPVAEIPSTYRSWKQLETVRLISYQQEFPTTIWSWKQLKDLNLTLPHVDKLEDEFQRLPLLESAYLMTNSSTIPKSLFCHPTLSEVYINLAHLSSFKLDGKKQKSQLEYAGLSTTYIEDKTTLEDSIVYIASSLKAVMLKNLNYSVDLDLFLPLPKLTRVEASNISTLQASISGQDKSDDLGQLRTLKFSHIKKELSLSIGGTLPKLASIELKNLSSIDSNYLSEDLHPYGYNFSITTDITPPRLKRILIKNVSQLKIALEITTSLNDFPKIILADIKGLDNDFTFDIKFNYQSEDAELLKKQLANWKEWARAIQKKYPKLPIRMTWHVINYNGLEQEDRNFLNQQLQLHYYKTSHDILKQ